MTDIIKFTFDFFAHVLPGLLIMVAISLFFIPIELIEKIMELENSATSIEEMQAYGTMVSQMMGNFDIGQGILITIVAYIVGFAASPFGKIFIKNGGLKFGRKKLLIMWTCSFQTSLF